MRMIPRMATQFSKLKIINAALLSQGQEPLQALNDGSLEWRMLSENWPGIVESELEIGNYHFTRKEAANQSRVDGKFGFDDGYLIPAEALHVRNVMWEDSLGVRRALDWAQDDSYAYCDYASGVILEYTVCSDEALWSANFSRGVQLMLEAVFLKAIEERAAARDMEAMAQISFQMARTHSSRQKSKGNFHREGGTFIDARRGRG